MCVMQKYMPIYETRFISRAWREGVAKVGHTVCHIIYIYVLKTKIVIDIEDICGLSP